MAPRKNRNVQKQKAKKRPSSSSTPQPSQVQAEDAETGRRPNVSIQQQDPISDTAQLQGSLCTSTGSTSTATSAAATAATASEDVDEDETEKGRDTDGEDTQPPGKRRRNSPRPPVILSEEENEKMAKFLKENDSLYNKSSDLWRDTQTRERLWDQQGQAMGRKGWELQQWYKSLRTKLGRLKKKAQKGGSEVLTDANRRLLQLFDFLTPHICVMQRMNVVSLQERIENRGPAPQDEGEVEDQEGGADRQVEPEVQLEYQEEAATNQPFSAGASENSTPFPMGSKGKAPQRSLKQQVWDALYQHVMNPQNNEQLPRCFQDDFFAQVLRTLVMSRLQHPDREYFANYLGSVLQLLPDVLYCEANKRLSDVLAYMQRKACKIPQESQFTQHQHTSLQPQGDPSVAGPSTSSGVNQPPCRDECQQPSPVSTSPWNPGNNHPLPYFSMLPQHDVVPSLSGRRSRESSVFSTNSHSGSPNDPSEMAQTARIPTEIKKTC